MCAFLYDSAFCWDLPMGIFYLSTAGLNKRANVKKALIFLSSLICDFSCDFPGNAVGRVFLPETCV